MRNGHYALIHLHRQRIGTEIGTKIERYGGTEIERSNTFRCLFVWVVWSLSLVGSLWFGSLWFGSVV